MVKAEQRHHSFVLRIWWEDDGVSRLWRGWIQHATSGEAAYVGTIKDLVTFIETHSGALSQVADATPNQGGGMD